MVKKKKKAGEYRRRYTSSHLWIQPHVSAVVPAVRPTLKLMLLSALLQRSCWGGGGSNVAVCGNALSGVNRCSWGASIFRLPCCTRNPNLLPEPNKGRRRPRRYGTRRAGPNPAAPPRSAALRRWDPDSEMPRLALMASRGAGVVVTEAPWSPPFLPEHSQVSSWWVWAINKL